MLRYVEQSSANHGSLNCLATACGFANEKIVAGYEETPVAQTTSSQECLVQCQADTECKAWTFDTATGDCVVHKGSYAYEFSGLPVDVVMDCVVSTDTAVLANTTLNVRNQGGNYCLILLYVYTNLKIQSALLYICYCFEFAFISLP